MKTFLEIVAEDIIRKFGTDLSRTAVVFPNKRASLFLNDHLARLAGKPVWSPAYITISELFRMNSSLIVGDSIKLICDLYHSFVRQTGIDETLDHFYGWGELLLADFDDIDKNMADADKVFANLKDLHELDDISFLSEEQKRILQKFFSNFSDDQETRLKKKFLELWSHFGDIYHDYRQRLCQQNIAYEGMLYREVAESKQLTQGYDRYLFIGFNLLHQVEMRVFHRLKDAGKAYFYWDFDQYYTRHHPENEAGHYISQYLSAFPNELDDQDTTIYDNLSKPKEITFISAPTEDIQARYIGKWLNEDHRINDGRKTAIVMCNEKLLQTVVHSLPEETEINITTGYPLQLALISSFAIQLMNLHIYGGRRAYRHLTHHPYSALIDLAACQAKSPANNLSLLSWLENIVRMIAQKTRSRNDNFEQESLFRMYTLLNRLHNLVEAGDLTIDAITLQKLLQQLIAGTSIPFHGEPAVGIQVMGVLETRNLDFEHVVLLSCNEGFMPKGVNDASFIPYSIRKAYGLTTIDNKVAVFAYYFHRLLQRAKDITILYNNSTEDGHTGEMSRFMLQLMVESHHHIHKKALHAGQEQVLTCPSEIPKDEAILNGLQAMAEKGIYPTFINRYLRCPLQFYYQHVAGILEPDDNEEEDIDSRNFGNIFHRASQMLYDNMLQRNATIMPSDIEELERHPEQIEMAVDKAIHEELPDTDIYNGLHLINREVIIHYLKRLLIIDKKLAPFYLLGLEKFVQDSITINTSAGQQQIKIGGIIDRLDIVTDSESHEERIRVVDYKTGNRVPTVKINSVEEIFQQPINSKKHTDYYLQTMLYACMVSHHPAYNKAQLAVSPALLFIQHATDDPTLYLGKEKMTDIHTWEEEFMTRVQQVLSEIFEPNQPFTPTTDRNICLNCPYHLLCGLHHYPCMESSTNDKGSKSRTESTT